jgi:antitoxin VapB
LKAAKLFRKGRNRNVRLPREFRFEGDRVLVNRQGDGVLLLPYPKSWSALIDRLARFSGDFLAERGQPPR